MAYRNKTYVCFDADNDFNCYSMMLAWKQNDKTSFNFYNAHEINTIRKTSSEETIKRKLRERMENAKVLIILVGEKTKNLYKYVRWEIDIALKMDVPIIVVNLNKCRRIDSDRCPAIVRDALAIHISYGPKIMQYALENWPASYKEHKKNGDTGGYYYKDHVYDSLDSK